MLSHTGTPRADTLSHAVGSCRLKAEWTRPTLFKNHLFVLDRVDLISFSQVYFVLLDLQVLHQMISYYMCLTMLLINWSFSCQNFKVSPEMNGQYDGEAFSI